MPLASRRPGRSHGSRLLKLVPVPLGIGSIARPGSDMMSFIRYTLNRLGQYSFLIGLFGMIGTAVVVGVDLPFYLRAVEVEAKVERIAVECTLKWRTVGSGGKSKTMESDRMECGKARSIKAGDPMAGYKLEERKRSYLSYV